MAKKLVFAIALIAMFALMGCSPPAPAPRSQDNVPVDVRDYGNGVYTIGFFDVPNQLSRFIVQHPDLRITAMYSGNEGVYGSTMSIVLVTEPRDSTNAK